MGYVPPAGARATLKLPESYRARDTNGDGQIGLYEWPRSDYATFRQLDRDGDGFLTPFELIKAADPSATLSDARRTPQAADKKAEPAAVGGAARDGDPAAVSVFESLDRNRDGSLDQEEWARSRTTRSRFEAASLSVTFPLSRTTFLQQYPQALAAAGVIPSR